MWQAIVDVVRNALELFGGVAGNYGVGIIILTVLVRLLLVPLTFSQNRMTAKMQKINPELQEIKKKYKDDSQKMNEETVKLWKEHGVNPAAGCLPLIIQMPIIIAMFTALRTFEFGADASFLWLPHLAQTDPLYLLPVMAAVSTFFQTRSTMQKNAAGGNQAIMMYGMPVFIGYISAQFPAGLALYLTVTQVFGVAQQYVVNHFLAVEARQEQEQEGESA